MTSGPTQSATSRFFRKARKYLRRFFTGLGITVMVVLLVAVFRGVIMGPSLPDNIVLTYNFKSSLGKADGRPSLTPPLLRHAVSFEDLQLALDHAQTDKRVKGFAATIEDIDLTPAQIQDLRFAVQRLRAAGKFAYVYSSSYGGMGSGMGEYYLASVFEQLWLQPVGTVAISGISAEVPFVRDLFDKIGVDPEFSHKGKYKSAPESLTAREMNPDHREMMTSIVSDLSRQILSDISRDRGMTAEQIGLYRDRSPFNDADALKMKFVDHLGYADDMLKAARDKAELGEKDKTVKLEDYIEATGTAGMQAPRHGKPRIALIEGHGEIVPYSGSGGGLGGGIMAATDIVKAFDKATEDKDVISIVFRIDSPGGSPEAAESIRHAVIRAQAAGKFVVVSMGGYAASGGYWIATPANAIVAEPATLTGSIGVFGGKLVLQDLWKKIGVNWDSVSEGKNAGMFSANHKFTPDEFAQFEAMLDNIYESFIDRVAEGRKLNRDQVKLIAEGRVWTGNQAKERALVDMLGGLPLAIQQARELANADTATPVVVYPEEKTSLENLVSFLVEDEDAAVYPSIRIDTKDLLKQFSSYADTLTTPSITLH